MQNLFLKRSRPACADVSWAPGTGLIWQRGETLFYENPQNRHHAPSPLSRVRSAPAVHCADWAGDGLDGLARAALDVHRPWRRPRLCGLTRAATSVATPHGTIRVQFETADSGGLRGRVNLPRGITGHYVLPTGKTGILAEGENLI